MLPPENARLKQAQDRVGSWLRDKIRLDSLLGVGEMAAVDTGTHRNAMRVAGKMPHPELSPIEEARTRFVREGYAANRVDHPGAVSVLDDDVTDEGHVFLVMELLVGETLEARKTRLGGALDPADVVAYADQILDVLIAAHEHQIVHRDPRSRRSRCSSSKPTCRPPRSRWGTIDCWPAWWASRRPAATA